MRGPAIGQEVALDSKQGFGHYGNAVMRSGNLLIDWRKRSGCTRSRALFYCLFIDTSIVISIGRPANHQKQRRLKRLAESSQAPWLSRGTDRVLVGVLRAPDTRARKNTDAIGTIPLPKGLVYLAHRLHLREFLLNRRWS